MNTSTQPSAGSALRLRHAAALLLMLGSVWLLSPAASAQLGSLVVTMSAPTAGATVTGTTAVSAQTTIVGGLTVSRVQFRLDGADLGAADTTAPYSIQWDTRTATNGSHTLIAVARDALGVHWSSQPLNVTVFNDRTPPVVAIASPAGGGSARGTITIAADATDNIGIAGVQFKIDGANAGAERTTAPYTMSWDTTTVSNAAHVLTAVARDAAGNSTTSSSVTILIDNAPPAVGITSPVSGAAVAGPITITAAASDNAAVAGVQFLLDGAALGGEDLAAPYQVAWDTVSASNGSHVITAVARDAAGNVATSAAVTIAVDNSEPSIAVTSPAAGATISGTVTVDAAATDNVGVAGVRVFVDGVALGTELVAAPYSVSWDTTTATEGSHVLTATARDAAGNTSTAASINVTVANHANTVTRVEDNGNTIAFTPPNSWLERYTDSRGWSGGTAALGSAVGQKAALNFNGTAVSWIGFRGPQTGIANVLLDGALVATVDAYSPTEIVGAVMFSAAGLVNGPHTIVIEVMRVKHEASSDYFVVVDAFDVTSPGGSAPVDTVPPVVNISSPSGGATVAGTANIAASASDDVGVVGVRFFSDGVAIGAEDTAAPYQVSWNTATAANGSRTLTAIARDAAGNTTTSAPVVITVANASSGEVTRIEDGDPSIAYTGTWAQGNMSRPWSGGTAAIAALTGTVARATFNFSGSGVSWIGFRGPFAGIANVFLDGALVASIDAYSAAEQLQSVMFAVSALAAGPHTLIVESTGTKNPSSADSYVVVDAFDVVDAAGGAPDTTPPAVAITWPGAGATVWNTTPLSAVASDNKAVDGVRFFIDGVQIGAEDTTAPFSIAWDSRTVTDGSHSVTAIARDAAGNTTTAAAVTIVVSNAAPPPPPAATRIEDTDAAIVYTAGTPAPGNPDAWFHGSRSRDWSNATSSFNRSKGARATVTFTGTSISWVGFRAFWAGIAQVYLDDQFVAELDLFLPPCTPEQRAQGCIDEDDQAHVFTATGLAPGPHTLSVRVTGERNPAATDNAVVVDGFDVAPSLPPAVIGTRIEESASSVTYTGSWAQGDNTRAWSGGTAAISTTAGSRATVTVTGTEIRWVGRRGPQSGIARIFLDGALQAEIDQYFPTDTQAVMYITTGLAPGTHTLGIEVSGLKNAASGGTAVAVDAFDARSRFEDRDASIVYSGTWVQEHLDKAWSGSAPNTGGGTAARSAIAGARAEFTFNGDEVQWIGWRGPMAGIADVTLDGVLSERIDLYSPAEALRVPVFTRTGLGPGPHTLRIDVTGLRNSAATNGLIAIDAFDVVLPVAAPAVRRVQQSDASVTYTTPPGAAAWSVSSPNNYFSGRTVATSATAGARATISFTGTGIRVIGQRRRDSGIARIYIDGNLIGEVDTFAAFQDEFQAAIFSASGLAPVASHTLTIEVTGTKRGGDTCTPGPGPSPPPCSAGSMIVVDAFEIFQP